MSEQSQPASFHDALMRRLAMIDELGANQTNLDAARKASMFNPAALSGGPGVSVGAAPNTSKAGGSFGKFVNAIVGQESGGNYNARNKSSGAMGKYQIMPGNIAGPGGWDKEALGYNISSSQFMASPQLQEAIAQYKLKQYYNKWGAAGAAVAWYAGPGTVSKYLQNPSRYTNPQGAYPSIAGYVSQILGRMR